VEELEKDLGAMTTEEQRAAVLQDAPELAALLTDLQSSLAEVRSRVGPLLKEASSLTTFISLKIPFSPSRMAKPAAAAAQLHGAAVLSAALIMDKGCQW
jgi:hypothetical protein